MLGEGCYNKQCWIIKSHHPEFPLPKAFNADKALVIIRNPIDTFISKFNLKAGGTQDKSIHPDEHERLRPLFEDMSEMHFTFWPMFYKYYQSLDIPVYFMRYEDILADPYTTFYGVMQFLLNEKDLKGRVIDKILQISTKSKAPEKYLPKRESFESKIKRFNSDQLKEFYKLEKDLIDFYGYGAIFGGED